MRRLHKKLKLLTNGTVLGQNSLNSFGGKICKSYKIHNINRISCKEYLKTLCKG